VAGVAVPDARHRGDTPRAKGHACATRAAHEQTAYVGGGVRYYLARRFFLRAEYKSHVVFTKRNQNDKVDEWKLGFAFFYWTVALAALSGCASVRNWYHHRSEVRAARAEAREEAEAAANEPPQDENAPPGSSSGGCAPQDQGTQDPQLEHRARAALWCLVHRGLRHQPDLTG